MLKRSVILFFILIVLYVTNAFLFPFPKKNVPEGFRPQYGTSYSFEQASWYGYDGRTEFVNLLDEVKFSWVRLPFFWDEMVDLNGEFNKNFEDLEFAIDEAGQRNVKVIVALGLKTPYYPEYHLPDVIEKQIKFGEKIDNHHPIANDVMSIDKKVVERLAKYENITHWQVENEPYLANINNWKIDKSLIRVEIDSIRSADRMQRPIILNHVGPAVFDHEWKNLIDFLGADDVFSVNAYFKTQGINLFSFSVFGREMRVAWPKILVWPVQSWYGFSPNFGFLGEQFKNNGRKFWVLEAQAEPYIRNIEDARRPNNYFRADDIIKVGMFLKSNRIEGVGFWGANYWIYRQSVGDDTWIEAVKSVVN
ncbi:MAG: hypothetical protein UU23_C0001G0135 [Candidatus Curtissbacteria bacterium GW2011_GWA1_40_9]|uniref:Glycoside hydrolase family 5 domain-containing protein n=1 Tax=Candidatus Curtissbacteria bacterium GW2011_GWA1_40_9 TaxID=1618408 RepID=A0A0G0TU59_9BACT|nr:MAG: hypothetical protein UU23_C0001G0135 [Candidatus Curtissbacteria bacterium GW2011_GWA1_40_9]